MSSIVHTIKCLLLLSLILVAGCTQSEPHWELQPNQRIALIGGNLGARMMHYGYFESELHARYPQHQLYIRNLCDGGDTPGFRPHSGRNHPWAFPDAEQFQSEFAHNSGSEGHFEDPDQWLNRLNTNIIVAFFGFSSSYEGVDQAQRYQQELQAFEKSLPPVTITANEEMHSEPRLDKKQPLFIRYVVSLKESIPTYLTSNLKKNALIVSLPILVCLVIGIWWFFPRQTPEEQLFATYFEPTKMEQTRARKDKTKGELQFEATRAYNNDEFGKAIPMLRELFEKHQDTTSLYFIGLAQLGSGLPDEAIQTLTFYNSIYEDVRYTRINYYIGLAHLWERRYDLAISFLQNDNTAESNQLINEINQLMNQ